MKHIFCILIAAFTLCACSNDDQESAPKYKNLVFEMDKRAYINSIINKDDAFVMKGSGVPRAAYTRYGKEKKAPIIAAWEFRQNLKSGKILQLTIGIPNPSETSFLIDRYTTGTPEELYTLPVSEINIYDQGNQKLARYIPSKENPLALGINTCIKLYRGELTYYWLEGYLEGTYYNKENPKDAITVKLKFGFI